jgi:hypothetical protein
VNVVASNHSYNIGGGSQAYINALIPHLNSGIVFASSAGNTAEDNDVVGHFPSD